MASFQSILKVGGKEYDILYSNLGLGQAVDSLGRPASAVYGGMITIEMNTPANDPTLYEWMVNPEKRMDGQVILRRLDSRAVLKSIKFYNAYCVDMVIRFDGTANASSFKTTIRISPEQIEIGGLLHDNLWPDETPMGYIPDETAPKEEEKPKKKEEPSALSEGLHTLLDVVGMIPIVGEIADGANALLYAAEGDYANAAMSAAAMIPLAGNVVGAAKLAKRGMKLVQKAKKMIPPKVLKKLDDGVANIKKVCEKDPVDVATGMMLTQRVDFELPGPIPLIWERVWYSVSDYRGPLGYGWHHRYDMGLMVETETNVTVLRLSEGRQIAFESPSVAGQPVLDRVSQLTLYQPAPDDPAGMPWRVWDQTQQVWYVFAAPSINGLYQPLYAVANTSGQRIEFTYGERGRLEQIIDSAGRLLTLSYNERNLVSGIYGPHPDEADAQIRLVGYNYSEAGDLTAHTDAEDNQWQHRYEDHLLVQTTLPTGLSFYWEYEGVGGDARCVHTWGDGGIHEGRFEYVNAQTTLMTDSDGTTQYRHQGGLVTRKINALGGEWRYEYNEFDELVAETDPLGAITQYGYDEGGNQLWIQYPDGSQVKTAYDEIDRVLAFTDERGSTWRYDYNEQGLQAQLTDPEGSGTEYTYDEQGRLITIINALGQATQLRYNDQNQVAHLVTPDEQIRSRSYDALGRLSTLTDPTGFVQRRQYDRMGRLTEVVETDGTRRSLIYNSVGNVTEVHQGDEITKFEYAGNGHMVARQQADRRIQFDYDKSGRLINLTNETGAQYHFTLDALGQVIEEESFDGLVRRYARDAASRITEVIRPTGQRTAYYYEARGRLSKVDYGDSDLEKYSYDGVGALIKAENSASVVCFERDKLGRVIKERSDDNWIQYSYNLLGQRTQVSSSLGASITLDRNTVGSVARIETAGWQAKFSYDNRGIEMHRHLSGGVQIGWQYDIMGRPTQQRIDVGRTSRERTYQWQEAGLLAGITDSQWGTDRFEYNQFGSLTKAEYQEYGEEVRLYDIVGNLFETADKQDRQYGTGGQLLTSNNAHYKYDEEGNLIQKTTRSGEIWQYQWGRSGLLNTVTRPDGAVVSFQYDALGRRLSKTYKGKVTRWVWEGNKPLHEWAELALNGQNTDEIITWLFEETSFAPIAKLQGRERCSILTDHLGTPLQMIDQTGASRWSASTTSYGRVRLSEGTRTDCPFRFQGQYEDVETGLYYNRFRYYDPESGNYISQDPLGLSAGMNFYAYVKDPLSLVDQLGLIATYSPLDALGRPTGVFAELTLGDLRPTGSSLPTIDPPGWVSGLHPQHQQRSHLLADTLGGSGSDPRNLVTLTDGSNHPGMSSVEGDIRRHLRNNPTSTVLLDVRPNYTGSNLIPDSVSMYALDHNGNVLVDRTIPNGLRQNTACRGMGC